MKGNSRQDRRGDSPEDVEHFKVESIQPTDFNKKISREVPSSNQGTRTARGADTIAKRQPS